MRFLAGILTVVPSLSSRLTEAPDWVSEPQIHTAFNENIGFIDSHAEEDGSVAYAPMENNLVAYRSRSSSMTVNDFSESVAHFIPVTEPCTQYLPYWYKRPSWMAYRKVSIEAARECVERLLNLIPTETEDIDVILHGSRVIAGLAVMLKPLYSTDADAVIASELGEVNVDRRTAVDISKHKGFKAFVNEHSVLREMVNAHPGSGDIDELIRGSSTALESRFLTLLRDSYFVHPLTMSMSEYLSAHSWDEIKFFANLEFPIDTADVVGAIARGVVLERPAYFQRCRATDYILCGSRATGHMTSELRVLYNREWTALTDLDNANGARARIECMPWDHPSFGLSGDAATFEITDRFDTDNLLSGLEAVDRVTKTANTDFFQCIIDRVIAGELSTDAIADERRRREIELFILHKVRLVTSPYAFLTKELIRGGFSVDA